MNFKKAFLVAGLILTITLSGCGSGSGGSTQTTTKATSTPTPALQPTTGTVSGVISFGGVTPSSLVRSSGYHLLSLTNNSGSTKVSNQKIIKFRNDLSLAEVEANIQAIGGQLVTKMYGCKNTYVIRINNQTVTASLQGAVNSNSNIEYLEDDHLCHVLQTPTPNDPYYGNQWNLTMMNFPAAWNVTTGNSSLNVAVVDTGVSATHQDLVGNLDILPGSNFEDGDPNNPTDENGHGTHMAGIIGAMTNNGTGIAGICWNIKIMPVRVLDATGSGYESTIAQGINFAVANGAKVINLSLGATETVAQASTVLKQAIDNAITAGVTVVAAVGNEDGAVDFPANYQPEVIAVAALDEQGIRAPYSNYGPEVSVCAPGGDLNPGIYSTFWSSNQGNCYAYESGTSMAAAHISGLAALYLALNPNAAPAEIKQHLQAYAINKGSNTYYGAGMPDASAVVGNLHATKYQEVKVFVGDANGVVEVSCYPDGNGNYVLSNVQPGIKFICAFLDTNMNGLVDTGDRFDFVSVNVQAGATKTVNINLVDVIGPGVSATLSAYLKANLH